jgi:hypothetical protein
MDINFIIFLTKAKMSLIFRKSLSSDNKMELSQDSIKYVVLILVGMIIFYILFCLYKDIMTVRSELAKLKGDLENVNKSIQEEFTEEDFEEETDEEHGCYIHELLEPQEVEPQEVEPQEVEPETVEGEIIFLQSILCPVILKTGKNKGKECGKETVENTGLCKKHNQ